MIHGLYFRNMLFLDGENAKNSPEALAKSFLETENDCVSVENLHLQCV